MPAKRAKPVTYAKVGTYRAKCSRCGWSGPVRSRTATAENDLEAHKRTAAHRKRAGRA